MRLNKFLSESGQWSRREADRLIEEGRVTVNGSPAELGTQVEDTDRVCVDGEQIGEARKKVRPVYIALHKPVGITCTTERHVAGNIIDFVDHPERVFPIGRLDKDSEGLILLTNDGDIVNEVLRAEHQHEKEYVVAVDRAITPEHVAALAAGVRLSDATTRPCKVERLGPKVFRITLTQGLNRQIRRMCEAFGYEVVALQRVRIMHIQLGQLPLGRWRNLSGPEVSGLMPRRPSEPRGPAGAPERGHPGPGRTRPGARGPRPGDPRGAPRAGSGDPRNAPRPGPPRHDPRSGGRRSGGPSSGGPSSGGPSSGGPSSSSPSSGGGRSGGGRSGGGRSGGGRPGGRPSSGRSSGARRGRG